MISQVKIFLQRKDNLVCLQLCVLILVFLILNILSSGSYGGGDDIVHYRFARYAFKYPSLYLDQWAKPLFTLLASPFAQLGYWGVRLFNVLVGAFTAFLVYKISLELKIKNGWLTPTLLFTVPVYTSMLLSGMTEILFGLILVLAIYLVLKKKYIWCAILVSLFPFSRTEGIIFWPAFLFILAWNRKWIAMPFILTGSLIYTAIGGFYYNDFLCLYTKMPYSGTYDIYGHGELLAFVKANKSIFGIPQTILFAMGVIAFVVSFFRKRDKSLLNEFILILSGIFIYYAAHSYVWWKGINSLGLTRVIACISPLFVIYVLRGVDLIVDLYKKIAAGFKIKSFVQRTATYSVGLIAAYVIISTPFKVYAIPVPLPEKEQIVKEAALWYKNSPYGNRKFYIWDQYFWFFLGIEPLDKQKMVDGIPDYKHPERGVLPGEMVIWDAHLSAVDGRFPIDGIISNPYYKLVKAFIPRHEIIVFGHPYMMCFFERVDSGNYNNKLLLDSLLATEPPNKVLNIFHKNYVSDSDSNGVRISEATEFFLFKEMEVQNNSWNEGDLLKVNLKGSGESMLLVVSLGDDLKTSYYATRDIFASQISELSFSLPIIKKNNKKLKVYIWNNAQKVSYIQHVEIRLVKYERSFK